MTCLQLVRDRARTCPLIFKLQALCPLHHARHLSRTLTPSHTCPQPARAPSGSAFSVLSRMSFPRERERALHSASLNDLIPLLVLTPGQRRIQTRALCYQEPYRTPDLQCWAVTGVKGLPVSLPNLAPGWLPASSALLIHDEGPQLFASHFPSSPGCFSLRSESILPHLYPVPASP